MKLLLSVCLLLCLSFDQPATVADKIVAYSLSNMGKKVDRGECWDLAAFALNNAGAKWDGSLNFGTKIDFKTNPLLPADILQFENVKFKGQYYSSTFPQHTAIVYKAKNKLITIFHQNYNGKRKVDTLTINLGDLAGGKLEAFRPVSK
ncbi:MAG: hypothetical protein K0S33_2177 [Bacteroidetes bacterium]|jgi:hypothetical protein|nr:hypothetical protein [Bacteroidota bacterium]